MKQVGTISGRSKTGYLVDVYCDCLKCHTHDVPLQEVNESGTVDIEFDMPCSEEYVVTVSMDEVANFEDMELAKTISQLYKIEDYLPHTDEYFHLV